MTTRSRAPGWNQRAVSSSLVKGVGASFGRAQSVLNLEGPGKFGPGAMCWDEETSRRGDVQLEGSSMLGTRGGICRREYECPALNQARLRNHINLNRFVLTLSGSCLARPLAGCTLWAGRRLLLKLSSELQRASLKRTQAG